MIAAPLSTVSLRCGVAVGSTSGREHDGVGAPDHLGQLLDVGRLEVDDGRLDAVLLEVGDVLGLADDADGLVAGLRDQAVELAGDLAVAACDDDAHVSDRRRRVASGCDGVGPAR